MSSINLYTQTTGGNRSAKTKDHANPDIAVVTMTINGINYEISGLELSMYPYTPIDHPQDLHNNVSICMEVTYANKTVNYLPFILTHAAIDNPDRFYFTGDSLTITLGDNLNYWINPTRFMNTKEKYPDGTAFKLMFTDSGITKLGKYLDRHFKDYM